LLFCDSLYEMILSDVQNDHKYYEFWYKLMYEYLVDMWSFPNRCVVLCVVLVVLVVLHLGSLYRYSYLY